MNALQWLGWWISPIFLILSQNSPWEAFQSRGASDQLAIHSRSRRRSEGGHQRRAIGCGRRQYWAIWVETVKTIKYLFSLISNLTYLKAGDKIQLMNKRIGKSTCLYKEPATTPGWTLPTWILLLAVGLKVFKHCLSLNIHMHKVD
jgi:hypothetical protein